MAKLQHCDKCHMTTVHVDGVCRRCETVKQYKKPMSDAAKAKLKAINEWRKGKIETDPRLAGEKETKDDRSV